MADLHSTPRPTTGSRWPRWLCLAAGLAVAAAVAVSAPDAAGMQKKKKKGPAPKAPDPAPAAADRAAMTDRVKASVARVGTKNGHGSGFLVLPNVVATNSHVVLTALPDDFTVEFMTDGVLDKKIKARLLYEDKSRDLALLLLAEEPNRPTLPLVKGFKTRTRAEVCVIGHPGQGEDGRVSLANSVGVARCDEDSVTLDGQSYYRISFVAGAGDIKIGKGNSGGPAVDAQGEVVGVLTAGDYDRATKRPTGRAYLVPAAAVQAAVDGLGSPAGWDGLVKKAGSRHAFDLYAVNMFVNADIAMQVIEARVKLKQQLNGFNTTQLAAKDKQLTALYHKFNKALQELAQPATRAMKDLTPAQLGQIKVLKEETDYLRFVVGKSGFGTGEYKRAQDAEAKVRKAFDQVRADSGMSGEFVRSMIRAVENAVN